MQAFVFTLYLPWPVKLQATEMHQVESTKLQHIFERYQTATPFLGHETYFTETRWTDNGNYAIEARQKGDVLAL